MQAKAPNGRMSPRSVVTGKRKSHLVVPVVLVVGRMCLKSPLRKSSIAERTERQREKNNRVLLGSFEGKHPGHNFSFTKENVQKEKLIVLS